MTYTDWSGREQEHGDWDDTVNIIRDHVAGRHQVTRLGCPVCADLPRQQRENTAHKENR